MVKDCISHSKRCPRALARTAKRVRVSRRDPASPRRYERAPAVHALGLPCAWDAFFRQVAVAAAAPQLGEREQGAPDGRSSRARAGRPALELAAGDHMERRALDRVRTGERVELSDLLLAEAVVGLRLADGAVCVHAGPATLTRLRRHERRALRAFGRRAGDVPAVGAADRAARRLRLVWDDARPAAELGASDPRAVRTTARAALVRHDILGSVRAALERRTAHAFAARSG
jgi:hypothetical protein